MQVSFQIHCFQSTRCGVRDEVKRMLSTGDCLNARTWRKAKISEPISPEILNRYVDWDRTGQRPHAELAEEPEVKRVLGPPAGSIYPAD
jgi:hypothetical protein